MVKQVWRREFHLQQFSLEHQRADDFLLCQWQSTRSVHVRYLLYRWLLSCFFFVTLICSICSISTDSICNPKWLIYLTNWGYLLYTLQAIISSCLLTVKLVTVRIRGADPRSETMKLEYKVFWALHTVCVVVAYCISITYWATIYDPKVHHLDAVNLLVHAVNSVVMTVDLFMVRHPVRLLHAYLPLSFTLVFFLFSIAYYLAGGTSRLGHPYIYAMLDWGRPLHTIICCALGLVLVLVMHAAVWSLYLLRCWLYRTLVCPGVRVQPQPVPSTSSIV